MTTHPYDQFTKRYVIDFLDPFGVGESSREINVAPHWVDVYFQPNAAAQEEKDPWLGLFLRDPCLIEPYRDPIDSEEVRTCLFKLLAFQTQKKSQTQLWILTPTVSDPVLRSCGAVEDPDYLGVYRMAAFLRAGIVELHKLPQVPETLWLRVLGKGSKQRQAIQELTALPATDRMVGRTLKLLADWKIMIDKEREALRQEERELLMNLSPAYLEWEERTLKEGIQLGKQEGIQLGEQRATQQVAHNLLATGMDPAQIATVTGLTLEQVQQLGEQRATQQVARNLLAAGMDPAQIATLTGLTLEQVRQLQN